MNLRSIAAVVAAVTASVMIIIVGYGVADAIIDSPPQAETVGKEA